MNWVHLLYWVLGIFSYLLMGGVTVWVARAQGLNNDPKKNFFLQIVFSPGRAMGIFWPIVISVWIVGFCAFFISYSVSRILNGFQE